MPDSKENKDSKYLMYLKANTLYEWKMSKYLQQMSLGDWLIKKKRFDVYKMQNRSKYGYTSEVDLEYLEDLHKNHNN